MSPHNITCGLYTRVSTQQQMDNDFNSLESQKEQLEAYCKLNKYAVYNTYEDGGFSGSTLERPALQKMIRDIVSKKINCVVVYKIDRLARSMRDFYELNDIFEAHDISFVSVSQNFDTSNSIGRLSLNMVMSFAQFEREMIADRIRDKMRQRASKGMWNGRRTPYGYYNENKQIFPNPETAPIVRFMFETYTEKPSLAYVREQLHARGWYNANGKPWNKTVIRKILSNIVYIGYIKCNDLRHMGIHESIVSDELFNTVQSLHPVRTHVTSRNNRVYLLQGLLRCHDCGSSLTPHYTLKRRKDGSKNRIPYYRCTTTAHHKYTDCSLKFVNANKIEERILDNIFKLASNDTILDTVLTDLNRDLDKSLEPLKKEERKLKKRIGEIESEITRFMNALGSGNLPVSRVETAIAEREKQMEVIQEKVEAIQEEMKGTNTAEYNADYLKASLKNFKTIFNNLTEKEKSEALQCMIQSIEVHPDKFVLNLYELQNVSVGSQKRSFWWSYGGSNPRPPDCQSGAHPS